MWVRTMYMCLYVCASTRNVSFDFFLLIGYPKLQQSQGRGVVQRGFPFGKETWFLNEKNREVS